jgi:D-3-phosphoglycerate dehydrogenase
LIRVKVKTGKSWRTMAGSVIAGQPRIVEVKTMELDAAFLPTMLFINNSDKPGFIGALGTMLGDAGINIATFNLGRVAAGEDAIALVGVDQVVPDDILAKLKALPQVRYAKVLRF